jgi:hypothetical protein
MGHPNLGRKRNLVVTFATTKEIDSTLVVGDRPKCGPEAAQNEAIWTEQISPVTRVEAIEAIHRRVRVLKLQLRLRLAFLSLRYLVLKYLCTALHLPKHLFGSRY